MSFADFNTLSTAIVNGNNVYTTYATPAGAASRQQQIGQVSSAPTASGTALTGPSTFLPQVAPIAAHNMYLSRLMLKWTASESLALYDRLVETGGLDGTVATAQTVNSIALPSRATGGAGVQLWLEWYAATGASQVTVIASYTNQAGTAGQVTPSVNFQVSPTVGGGGGGHETQQLPLAAGDTGVRSVQSVTLSATTGTAGNFGITLRTPIILFGALAGFRMEIDPNKTLLPPITAATYIEGIDYHGGSSGTNINIGVNYAQD